MSRTERLAILLTILTFFTFFFGVIYPSISSFDYWNMAMAVQVQKTGRVSLDGNVPGFYISTVVMSQVSSLSYRSIPTLPIQSIPLILFLAVILRRLSRGSLVYLPIVLAYVTFPVAPSQFTWGSHNVAFILFLAIVFAGFKRLRIEDRRTIIANSVAIIVMIASLNFLSYKLTFLSIMLLIMLELVRLMGATRKRTAPFMSGSSFGFLAAFGIVFTFLMNSYFYRTFIPSLRLASEGQFSYSTGLQKILARLSPTKADPLASYYLTSPSPIFVEHLLHYLLVFAALFVIVYPTVGRLLKNRDDLTNEQRLIFALFLTGLSYFVLYQLLGHPGLDYLTLTGIACLALRHRRTSKRTKQFSVIVIGAIIALNCYEVSYLTGNPSTIGPRDAMEFSYIYPSAMWYIENSNLDSTVTYETDVFTFGYFMIAGAEHNFSVFWNLDLLTREQLKSLLEPNRNDVQDSGDNNSEFIINYRLDYIELAGWEAYVPFSEFRDKMNSTPMLTRVYSSGYIEVFSR